MQASQANLRAWIQLQFLDTWCQCIVQALDLINFHSPGFVLPNTRCLARRHELVADDLRSLIQTANAPIFGVDAKGQPEGRITRRKALNGFHGCSVSCRLRMQVAGICLSRTCSDDEACALLEPKFCLGLHISLRTRAEQRVFVGVLVCVCAFRVAAVESLNGLLARHWLLVGPWCHGAIAPEMRKPQQLRLKDMYPGGLGAKTAKQATRRSEARNKEGGNPCETKAAL